MKKFAFWFGVEFLSFALIVANGRAYNQGNYTWTFITDFIINVNSFIVGAKFAREAVNDKVDWQAVLGGGFGGACGSLFAIWFTKIIYGA